MQIWQIDDEEFVRWFPSEAAARAYMREDDDRCGETWGDVRPACIELPAEPEAMCELVNAIVERALRLV